MPAGGQMGQPVHVLQQGVMQPQSQGIPNDGGHNMPVGMVDQTRPIATKSVYGHLKFLNLFWLRLTFASTYSYGPQGTTHMQSVPMYPIGGPGKFNNFPSNILSHFDLFLIFSQLHSYYLPYISGQMRRRNGIVNLFLIQLNIYFHSRFTPDTSWCLITLNCFVVAFVWDFVC